MAHIYLLSRVNVILDTLWIQKCVSVLQGFLYEVGGWVTGVTGRDFGPRWVEKPCWTFTQSIWRGRLKRAARRPCCSSVEKNIVVILVRDNFQQICPVWFRQHTRGEPAMSRVFAAVYWSLYSFPITVYWSMKRMILALESRSFAATTSCALYWNKHQRRKKFQESVEVSWKYTKKNQVSRNYLIVKMTPTYKSSNLVHITLASLNEPDTKEQHTNLFPLCFRPKKPKCRCDHTLKASKTS